MSVIASNDIGKNNFEYTFDKKTLQKLEDLDIEDLDYVESSGGEEEQEKLLRD